MSEYIYPFENPKNDEERAINYNTDFVVVRVKRGGWWVDDRIEPNPMKLSLSMFDTGSGTALDYWEKVLADKASAKDG